MSIDVESAAMNMVDDYRPGGASVLGPLIGKAAGTLSHEVNPHCKHAKLGLADAVKLSKLTNDRRVLEAFAAAMDCLVVPLGQMDSSEPETMEALGRSAKEFAEFIAATAGGLADGAVSENELSVMEREASDLLSIVSKLLGLARARHEGGKPGATQA